MANVDAPFEEVLPDIKAGKRATRVDWDDSERYVVGQRGYPEGIGINKNTSQATGLPEGTQCIFDPYLMIREFSGHFAPWTPSQEDLFATDWYLL